MRWHSTKGALRSMDLLKGFCTSVQIVYQRLVIKQPDANNVKLKFEQKGPKYAKKIGRIHG